MPPPLLARIDTSAVGVVATVVPALTTVAGWPGLVGRVESLPVGLTKTRCFPRVRVSAKYNAFFGAATVMASSCRARTYTDGTNVLPAALERVLLTGRHGSGPATLLRSLDDWRRAWGEYRDVVLPKAIQWLPGRRPLACYVCGEIEPRPLWGEPPLDQRWFRLYVPGNDGTGQWHHDYPEPWQERETAYLWRIGQIDADELRRARTANYRQAMREYPWEQGAFV